VFYIAINYSAHNKLTSAAAAAASQRMAAAL